MNSKFTIQINRGFLSWKVWRPVLICEELLLSFAELFDGYLLLDLALILSTLENLNQMTQFYDIQAFTLLQDFGYKHFMNCPCIHME